MARWFLIGLILAGAVLLLVDVGDYVVDRYHLERFIPKKQGPVLRPIEVEDPLPLRDRSIWKWGLAGFIMPGVLGLMLLPLARLARGRREGT